MLFMLPSGCIFPGKIRVQFAVQSAFAIVEPKQGQALFSPVAIPDGGTTRVSVEALPCKRKRNLLMEKATKAKMESDRD